MGMAVFQENVLYNQTVGWIQPLSSSLPTPALDHG